MRHHDSDVSLTRQAARRLLSWPDERLSTQVRTKVAICLLDHLACCLDGLGLPSASAARKFVAGRPAKPEAHHWGLDYPIAAGDAAFGNAIVAHGLIRDDMHVGSGVHIGVMVMPAMLALAQRNGLSGTALARGIVAGYDMAASLGSAIRTGAVTQHFRPSGMVGAFGAASGAVAATRPEEDTAVHALGFAANFAAGLNQWPWSGGQEIFAHAGLAARNGLAAFDLACAGLTASEPILEGRDGMFAAYGAGPDAATLFVGGIKDAPAILDVRHKPYAGCNYIMTPIRAAIDLREQLGGSTEAIEEVVVHTFSEAREYPGCDSNGPFTSVQQSKMSIQYGVAAALLLGRVDERAYASLADPELARLIGLCRVELDPDLDTAFPVSQPTRIDIRHGGGGTLSQSRDDVPWLSDAAVESRFREAAKLMFAHSIVEQMMDMAHALCDLTDSRRLTDLFATIVQTAPAGASAARLPA